MKHFVTSSMSHYITRVSKIYTVQREYNYLKLLMLNPVFGSNIHVKYALWV